ncbi:sugar-binding transcriptional regulator [Orbus sturtevantii]|uniref:sugar-binding transcriptional regulator n=1 Tax=Orbus sturtevantii TaxID=3074109 RepID=UPI00370D9528
MKRTEMRCDINKQNQIARVAWLYYVAGKTQLEIGHILGLSRQIVQRLLSSAKECGIVNVKIMHPISECMELAEKLQAKFNLSLCRVIPSLGLEKEAIDEMMAIEGANVMGSYIQQDQPLTIGVGSGKTLSSIIDILPYSDHPQHICVSLIGAIASDGSATRYDVPLKLAEKIQCKYYILPAPLYADSVQDKQDWSQHKAYQIVKDKAEHAHVVFAGIGEIGIGCPLNTEKFLTDNDVTKLSRLNAVAELLGCFINDQGEYFSNPFDEMTTSIRITKDMSATIIGFASGTTKYQAVQAVLKGGMLNGLVTDEQTAIRLLEN